MTKINKEHALGHGFGKPARCVSHLQQPNHHGGAVHLAKVFEGTHDLQVGGARTEEPAALSEGEGMGEGMGVRIGAGLLAALLGSWHSKLARKSVSACAWQVCGKAMRAVVCHGMCCCAVCQRLAW